MMLFIDHRIDAAHDYGAGIFGQLHMVKNIIEQFRLFKPVLAGSRIGLLGLQMHVGMG